MVGRSVPDRRSARPSGANPTRPCQRNQFGPSGLQHGQRRQRSIDLIDCMIVRETQAKDAAQVGQL